METPIADTESTAATATEPKRRGPKPSAKRGARAPQNRTESVRAEPVRAETQRPAVRPIPKGLTRVERHDADMFYIPANLVPPGWTYEWKRTSCFNEPDPHHMADLRENHWEPVPADRHPGVLVEQKGQMLMERPAYLTNDAYDAQFAKAQRAVDGVTGRLTQAPQGHFTREHPSARRATKINRNYDMGISVDASEAEER